MNTELTRSLLVLIAAALVTAQANAEMQDQSVTLRVKPQLCITPKRGQPCETSFLVRWQSEDTGDYCLKDDDSITPLRCWDQDTSGSFDEQRVVVRSFSYWLSLPGLDPPLAEARVELMTIDSSDRRRSRRNRHAWSIR